MRSFRINMRFLINIEIQKTSKKTNLYVLIMSDL